MTSTAVRFDMEVSTSGQLPLVPKRLGAQAKLNFSFKGTADDLGTVAAGEPYGTRSTRLKHIARAV